MTSNQDMVKQEQEHQNSLAITHKLFLCLGSRFFCFFLVERGVADPMHIICERALGRALGRALDRALDRELISRTSTGVSEITYFRPIRTRF
jgi:hypothetical protein